VIKLNKAYKFRLYPNKAQSEMINKTIGCARFIYNKMLDDKISFYKENKAMLKNSPAQYKKEFEFLKEVDSLALANSQINLNKAFSNFFSKNKKGKKSGFPKFKSKRKSNNSYTTNNQNGSIRIENKKVKLPKIGFIKVIEHRKLDGKIKSATISLTKTGKYFISILVEYESQVQAKKIKNVIGLDFSMKSLYVDSNGNSADYPRFFRKSISKLVKKQRVLSKCKIGGSNYKKQKRKVALLHEKVANQRKDFLHKKSHYLSENYDMVCIEDLDMKGMSKCLNFGKSVSDNSWGMFTGFLSYKLTNNGKLLFKVDKWFPSSKKCSSCGELNKSLKLSDRSWVCDFCGAMHDRDENAANNLKTAGTAELARVNLRQ